MNLQEKKQLFSLLIANLHAKLDVLVQAAFEAKEASTNEESKAENKYDTRGLEASYLASGQAKRAQELQEQIFLLGQVELRQFTENEPINISSVVNLVVDEVKKKTVFLMPIGGVELHFQNKKIQTLTLDAPLGRQLHGQKVGHEFDMNGRFYQVTEVL